MLRTLFAAWATATALFAWPPHAASHHGGQAPDPACVVPLPPHGTRRRTRHPLHLPPMRGHNPSSSRPRTVLFLNAHPTPTTTIIHSENVLLEDIYVNSTDAKQAVGFDFSSLNTDGVDTVYVNNVTFRRWIVDNGDDSIAMKANSTNILIEDCAFYTGLGVAIGSIGQYEGAFETIENVTARNISIHHMRYGAYVKTWTGVSTGYPPNGGGGGLGYAANVTFSDFALHNASGVFGIHAVHVVQRGAQGQLRHGRRSTSATFTLRNWDGHGGERRRGVVAVQRGEPVYGDEDRGDHRYTGHGEQYGAEPVSVRQRRGPGRVQLHGGAVG
ncbi:pectin lyase-like protein [Punctularia strigosozonata HHB-11173 SS5]|uniref:pectin lyase-like protein n=1 Tax=Punctularia strigosozonata (strain HHB-11173) TaxID=741275 RepID=UPI0004416A4F|nr:pectin lyase-like protein [Punctularia strigosozonata HHB-11173 SS5]EIN05502.1 pectin lyase-like protein [Punctularia strigosozonata HHB-11173 SS5]